MGGDTSITTGRDADQITLTRTVGQGMLTTATTACCPRRPAWRDDDLTGNGQDLISLSMADFLGRLHVESGAGNDKIWMSQILLGAGATVLGMATITSICRRGRWRAACRFPGSGQRPHRAGQAAVADQPDRSRPGRSRRRRRRAGSNVIVQSGRGADLLINVHHSGRTAREPGGRQPADHQWHRRTRPSCCAPAIWPS